MKSIFFFFASRRRHTRLQGDWSSDVCSSDLIDGWPSHFAIGILQFRAYKIETDMAIDQTQEVVFREVIFQTEVVKQGFGTGVSPHHDQQASENGDPAQHAQHS